MDSHGFKVVQDLVHPQYVGIGVLLGKKMAYAKNTIPAFVQAEEAERWLLMWFFSAGCWPNSKGGVQCAQRNSFYQNKG